jgi:hypothetical protein
MGMELNTLWYREALEYYSIMKRMNTDIGKNFVNSQRIVINGNNNLPVSQALYDFIHISFLLEES